MKNRYDGAPGKDAMMANVRQKRYEYEHKSNNEFVKSQERKIDHLNGKIPDLKPESMHFNAYMCNNGEHAQELARSITKGLDKEAFPVK